MAAATPRRDGGLLVRGIWCRLGAYLRDPEHVAFWGIVLLAAALRLVHLDLVEFKGDEAAHLLRAAEIAELHHLPLVGSQASVGIAKPPMMGLLMALPLLLGRDPRLASAFIALLNVAAVAGCYLLARRYYGLRVAILAATLFAANPWAVVLSRKVFTADVLAPFLVLTLYGLHVAVVDHSAWGWLVAVLGLAVALNVTFSPLPLTLVLVVFLALHRHRVRWRYPLAGAAAAGLLFLPYLYAQVGHLGELKALLLGVLRTSGPSGSPTRWQSVLRFATQLHSGAGLGALAGASFTSFTPAHSPLRALDQVAGFLFLASSAAVIAWALLGRRAKKREQQGLAILALWLVVAMGGVCLPVFPLEQHYLVTLYPVGFLAMALTLDGTWRTLARSRARPLRLLLPALGLFLVAWQAYATLYLLSFVGCHDVSGGYGYPLRHWQRIADLARQGASSADVSEVWVVTDGADLSYEQSPLILHYLLGPHLDTAFLGQGGKEALLLPVGRPAVYLVTRSVSPALESLLVRWGGVETGTAEDMGQVSARLIIAPARSRDEILSLLPYRAAGALDAGLELLGYGWPATVHPGETVSLVTYWEFGEVPPGEQAVGHSLFNHLLDPAGNRISQQDGFGLHERHWRAGLVLAQCFDLALPADAPAGDYTLLTGMYRLSDLVRSRVVSPQGQDAGDSISLGPLHVAR